ncbi:hypothetical protein [Chitinophaga arvensicola]|uniref:Uncharacterized protein n=1 Tax=Chitinophaga arvensicola TaxID=29529 RepID=A0A1I0S6I3_9BACT|nr:hypothetical protein [Chitinophaga arvensicola]SEW51077.1 hypothetical protein SAMN04488122_4112 [Chitinophaga arvensicola]
MRLYYLLIIPFLLTACGKEAALTPDPVMPMYTLPQGNQVYDDTIVAWYKQYNTYVLYKFTQLDYAYNYTEIRKDSAFSANPAYIAASLKFLRTEILNTYPDAFLKATMPYKILLASWIGGNGKRSVTGFATTSSMLAMGWVDSTLTQKTPAELKLVRGWLHRAYMECAFRTGYLTIPDAFKLLAPRSYQPVEASNMYSFGMLEPNDGNMNVVTDFLKYIELLTSQSKADLEAGLWSKRVDVNGLIRKKSAVVLAHFLNNYQIDLQAIGGRL